MDDLYIESVIKKYTERSSAAEDKQQKETRYGRRKHHRQSQYPVKDRLCPVVFLYDLAGSPKAEEERYNGRYDPGLKGYP